MEDGGVTNAATFQTHDGLHNLTPPEVPCECGFELCSLKCVDYGCDYVEAPECGRPTPKHPSAVRVKIGIIDTPRFRALPRRQALLMRELLLWNHPTFGRRHTPANDRNLAEVLGCSVETVRRARNGLIERGLIIDYTPGTGHRSGEYVLARTWAKADAVAERGADSR